MAQRNHSLAMNMAKNKKKRALIIEIFLSEQEQCFGSTMCLFALEKHQEKTNARTCI